jgi:hypothetical protein
MKLNLLHLATLVAAVHAGKNGNGGGSNENSVHNDLGANHEDTPTDAPNSPPTTPPPTHPENNHPQYTLPLGAACQVTYNENNGKYNDAQHAKCDDGLVCVVGENDVGGSGVMDGLCALSTCFGKRVSRCVMCLIDSFVIQLDSRLLFILTLLMLLLPT